MGCGRSGMAGRFMTGWRQEGRSRPDGLRRSIGLCGRRRCCRLATLSCRRRGVAASRRGIGSCCIAFLHLRCQLGSVRRTSSCSRPGLRLDPGDLAQLLAAELGDRGVRAWAATAVGRACCLGQQRRGWWGPQFIGMSINPSSDPHWLPDDAVRRSRDAQRSLTSGSRDRPLPSLMRSPSVPRRDRRATRPRPPQATLPPTPKGGSCDKGRQAARLQGAPDRRHRGRAGDHRTL
jgi:hypothetical protein